jgi:hypothetical protein
VHVNRLGKATDNETDFLYDDNEICRYTSYYYRQTQTIGETAETFSTAVFASYGCHGRSIHRTVSSRNAILKIQVLKNTQIAIIKGAECTM